MVIAGCMGGLVVFWKSCKVLFDEGDKLGYGREGRAVLDGLFEVLLAAQLGGAVSVAEAEKSLYSFHDGSSVYEYI